MQTASLQSQRPSQTRHQCLHLDPHQQAPSFDSPFLPEYSLYMRLRTPVIVLPAERRTPPNSAPKPMLVCHASCTPLNFTMLSFPLR